MQSLARDTCARTSAGELPRGKCTAIKPPGPPEDPDGKEAIALTTSEAEKAEGKIDASSVGNAEVQLQQRRQHIGTTSHLAEGSHRIFVAFPRAPSLAARRTALLVSSSMGPRGSIEGGK